MLDTTFPVKYELFLAKNLNHDLWIFQQAMFSVLPFSTPTAPVRLLDHVQEGMLSE